jgi:diaminohydroxyphosphoribosylaminopyrimidine deaminase/5-amino-6-(5-phosphoribosylamino)uracil reductase
MSRALALARRGRGKTAPNPLVGAVAAKQNRIIGEGWHRQYGGPHAEAEALDAALAAGETTEGADLYCTLEPCCFTAPDKHQDPCTKRIIAGKIRRVFIANQDPNPKVNGGGIRALEEAGIHVVQGLLAAEGERLNQGFFTFQRLGRPFVRLKIAQSLDGRIACAGGDARWITDEAARRAVHRMRRAHDAVLIGRGTALADDPELTVRLVKGANPLRAVLDSRLSLPASSRILRLPEPEKTLIFCVEKDYNREKACRLREQGAAVIPLGELSLPGVLAALAAQGARSVLVEGGAAVFTSFLKAGLWDRIAVFTAPLMLGQGISWAGDLGISAVKDAIRLEDVLIKRIGQQVLLDARRKAPAPGSRG